MSTLQGNNTTFNPMDWYKQMTNCLANKKNCKINLSRVPGGKEIKENKRLPPKITNYQLQNKFLAKYNEKRQQKEQEGTQNNVQRPNVLGFDLKQRNPPTKRPNKDDDFINLPSTYFKSTNVPDLSIFKVPAVPPAKKPRIEKQQDKTADFSLESLFSGNFKPPKASTPLEPQLKPIVSSPGDILNFINESRLQVVQAFESRSNIPQKEDPKLKEFLSLVDKVAKKIDSTCFSKVANPIDEIINGLQQTNDIATQSPRESLYSPSRTKSSQMLSPVHLSSISQAKPISQPRPVPVFYQQPENEMDIDNQSVNDSIFDKTFASNATFTTSSRANDFDEMSDVIESSTFNFTRDDDDDDDIIFSPVNFDFGTTLQTPFLHMIDKESILMTKPTRKDENDEDDQNWFDDNFLKEAYFEENQFEASSADIFRSPPTQRSSRYDLQRKFNEAFNVGRQNAIDDDSASTWSDNGASAMFDSTFHTL